MDNGFLDFDILRYSLFLQWIILSFICIFLLKLVCTQQYSGISTDIKHIMLKFNRELGFRFQMFGQYLCHFNLS